MINQASYTDARQLDRSAQAVAIPSSDVRMHRHGMAGALLGATWFGAAFPIAISAMTNGVGAADTLVYVACGALFGIVSGGSIGAVIGGRGR